MKETTILIFPINEKFGKCIDWKETKTKKVLRYMDKDLEFIDFRETTAWNNWVNIKFKNEKEIYTEDYNRLNYLWVEK